MRLRNEQAESGHALQTSRYEQLGELLADEVGDEAASSDELEDRSSAGFQPVFRRGLARVNASPPARRPAGSRHYTVVAHEVPCAIAIEAAGRGSDDLISVACLQFMREEEVPIALEFEEAVARQDRPVAGTRYGDHGLRRQQSLRLQVRLRQARRDFL